MKPIAVFLAVLATLARDGTRVRSGPNARRIDRARADASWEQARKIWEWAEVGYHEDALGGAPG